MKVTVLWLAPYPMGLLEPEVRFTRMTGSHACSWIVSLASQLSLRSELHLYVATASAGIGRDQEIRKKNITFHVIRHAFPFTMRGFPRYLPLDVLTRYRYLRDQISAVAERVQPDIIHAHGTEYAYALAALDTGVPTVVSMQGIINRIREVEDTMFYRLQAPLERDVIRRAKFFGTRTEWAKEFVQGLNPNAIIYELSEAVNPIFFMDRQSTKNENLLFVGSIDRRKGIEVAIEAMQSIVREYPAAKLRIVGGGKQRYIDKLKQRIRENNLVHVIEWLGSKSQDEVAALHGQSSILIHPTFIDNSPNSVAEAMVSGLPVVASNVGGIPSMIEDGVTGALVPPRNPAKLADAIVRLLKDSATREKLSANAQAVARRRHLPQTVAEQTVEVYKDILKKEKGKQ